MSRILYIANARIPTEKAHGIQIMKMCEAFAAAGNVVTLVIPHRFNHIQTDPYTYYGVKKNFEIKKVISFDLIFFGKIGFLVQSFSFAFFAFAYTLFHKRDVVYTRDYLSAYLSSFTKQRYLWEVHTKVENLFIRRVVHRADVVIAISAGLKRFYKKRFKEVSNIFVAHDGVDLALFSSKKDRNIRNTHDIPQDAFLVGYVGKFRTMGMKKGVEEIISSFGTLHKEASGVHLLLVGIEESEKEEVENLLSCAGAEPQNYTLVSHIPQEHVVDYLKASDVLVMNYPFTEHYAYYMSPLKLFEYMASGVPIVTTDLPSVREVLNEKSAVFIEPGNEAALVRGIKEIFSDRKQGDALAKEAFRLVQQYTWNNRARTILAQI